MDDAAPASLPLTATARRRLNAIDALRGAVMIVMALDHVRDFIHRAAMSSSPTDLAVTTPVLFVTRWITHFCAPVFMLTAGLGAFLWWKSRGRTKPQLSIFLVTRGLWLVVLELTVMQLAYNFDVSAGYPIFLLVLWVLGVCMIGMAALIWLPRNWLMAASIAVLALHNLADGVRAASLGSAAPVWTLLHQAGAFRFAGRTIIVGYPLIPWIAVMAAGLSLGPLFFMSVERRRRILLRLGVALTLAFILIRGFNRYGDPAAWSMQRSAVYTVMSFLNVTKYPPSLAFVLMTVGPALIGLAWLERQTLRPSNPLVVFGRVPLLYFVLHFFVAHLAAAILALVVYGARSLNFIFQPLPSMGGPRDLFPPDFGFDLWVVYAVWIVAVAAMYPVCRWFAAVKERRRDWWLSYL